MPENTTEILNPDQLSEARRYHRAGLRYMVLDRVVDFCYLGAVTFFAAFALDGWLQTHVSWLAESVYLRALALILLVTAGHIAISFPVSFFSDFVLEHQFHLSTLKFGGWLRRYALRMVLACTLNVGLMLGLLFVIRNCGVYWWGIASVLFFLISVGLGMFLPVVILPLFYKTERMEDDTLLERLRALASKTTLKLEGIYRMELSAETTKANACLAGLGSTRRVLLGDTLLEKFTPEEIEGVFAHELGHHVHKHIIKLLVGSFFASLAAFWLMDVLLKLWLSGASVNPFDCVIPFDYANLPAASIPFFMFVPLVFSWISEPLQNTLSRHFERQADTYACEAIRNCAALKSVFTKLAIQNKADPEPSRLEEFWLYSHPCIAARIRMVEDFEKRQA